MIKIIVTSDFESDMHVRYEGIKDFNTVLYEHQ